LNVPYAARLVTILGDIARAGRSGLLLLDASAGEGGGALILSRGLCASFRSPSSSANSAQHGDATATGIRRSIAQTVASIATAGAGAARPSFKQDEAQPPTAPSAAAGGLNAADLAVDLARQIEDIGWLTERLSALGGSKVSLSSSSTAVQPHLALGPGEGYLLSRADGTLTVREILRSAPLGEIETMRAIFSLIAVGMLAPPTPAPPIAALDSFLKKTGTAGATPTSPEQKERDDLLARCRSMGEQDYYQVLGVEPTADESTIRHTYYRLARAYHPDRLLKPHLEDIHRELEGMFASITDAYNTLSDPASRSEYDRERTERAAGRRKSGPQDKHTAARESYARGRKEEEAGHLFEAIRYYETAIMNDPTRAEYFHHLGVCQGQNPRWRKKAEENLLQAIKINPGAVRSYLELARVYRKGGLTRRASEMYQQLLKWEPANAEALEALGRGKDAAGSGLLGGLFKKE